MKKKFIVFIILLLSISACQKENEEVEENKVNVVSSFYPIHSFVKEVGGEKVNSINLLEQGDAHGMELKSSDMEALINSDLVFINGLGMESWVDKLDSSYISPRKIIDTSKGIDLIFANHEEDNGNHHIGHDEHNHGEYDPHIWLSLKNSIIQMENIKNALIEIDSDNKDYYEDNYERARKKYQELDDKYSELFSSIVNKKYVVPHAAFSYLDRDYGLEQLALQGVNSSSEPSLEQMRQVVDGLKKDEITTIFFEKDQDDKLARILAEEISSGKVKSISTAEGISRKDKKRGVSHYDLMKENLANLYSSFNR